MPRPLLKPLSRRIACAFVLVLAVAGLWTWYAYSSVPLPTGVSKSDYQQIEQQYRRLYQRSPGRLDALSLLAETALTEGRHEVALACFREIPSTHPQYGLSARLQQGQVCLDLNQALGAEKNLREFLKLASRRSVPPEHLRVAYERLAFILSVELRFEERRDILDDMHALHLATVFDSKQLFFPNLLIWNSTTGRHRLKKFVEHDPQDVRLSTSYGRYLTAEGKLAEAKAHLQALHEQRPDDLNCIAALMECHYEQNNWDPLIPLAGRLPDYQPTEPWLLTRLRGEVASHAQDWKTAVVQFERLQLADPANPWAQSGLAKAYGGLKQADMRTRALQRSKILSQIRVDLMTVKEEQPQPALELAKLCEQAGLKEAADIFRQHAARIKAARTMPNRAGTGGNK